VRLVAVSQQFEPGVRHGRLRPAPLPAARRLAPARRRWISPAIDPETGERCPSAREQHGLPALPPEPPAEPSDYPDSSPQNEVTLADAPRANRAEPLIYSNEELLRRAFLQ
jgi:hypothetical protein